MAVGALMTVVWPPFQRLIFGMGGMVDASGYLGTFIYGFVLRMLGPFGLHHIFYLPFWTTALGGSEVINGQLVEGTQRIFFAQLADPNTQQFYIGTARFMSGRFITMMFGTVGACPAMYQSARPENRKRVGGLLLSAALTSFLTGITEPIEFSFLFIAPALYVVHALFDGPAFTIAHILHITIGQTFSGGFIDFMLFGVLQGEAKPTGCTCRWSGCPVLPVLLHVPFPDLALQFQNAGARGGNRAGSGDDRLRTLAAGAGGAGRQREYRRTGLLRHAAARDGKTEPVAGRKRVESQRRAGGDRSRQRRSGDLRPARDHY